MTLPRRSWLRLRFAIYTGILVSIWVISRPPTAEIRSDTGDLRFLYFGIPLSYQLQQEPERSQLLALADGSKRSRPTWIYCPIGSHGYDGLMAERYCQAALWINVDPRIAQIIVDDIATHLLRHGAQSFPESYYLEHYVTWHSDGEVSISPSWRQGTTKPFTFKARDVLAIDPAWRQDPQVLDFLKSKGYVPPATEPSAR